MLDYNELDELKKFIDETLDHRHLNEVFGHDDVTAENLACYLYDWSKQKWPQVSALRVSETPKTWAEYTSPAATNGTVAMNAPNIVTRIKSIVQEIESSSLISVSEIFGPTIQGEGSLIGTQTIFVRTGGCDYRCSWCDTGYAVLPEHQDDWQKHSADAVMAEIETF